MRSTHRHRSGGGEGRSRAVVVFAFLLAVAVLPGVMAGSAVAQSDFEPVDVGPEIREWEATPDRIAGLEGLKALQSVPLAAVAKSEATCVTDSKVWLSLDNYSGFYFFDVFYKMAESTVSEIWVQADLSWPVDDPRDTPVVTCDQAAYMMSEFDATILPTESAFLGPADFHDGSLSLLEAWGYFPPGYYTDTSGRQIVLVSNVVDDNYHDPDYPIYIAGFYSPTFEAYFDRNVMSIDAFDWLDRTGPDGSKPYLYEGVFAHEYQHLLHDDYDPAEELWINEGLADWAAWLCGYPMPTGHLDPFMETPENSLVAWGDQGDLEILADYGIAYLYQQYMFEQYGPAFIQTEFLDGASQGIASVNSVLGNLGAAETFADTFHDFSVATYTTGAFDLDELQDFQVDVGHPGIPNPEAFETPGAPPWGTDYYLLWGYERIGSLSFNGIQFNPVSWTSDGEVLWGGTGDLIDNWAIFDATAGNTLTFDTSYDIEDFWDFGFVQVSTDGGSTWTSLSNASTTSVHDPAAHPNIIANLPGLTGLSSGWVTMSYDTSAHTGQDVLFAFRYMTDWATNFGGWFIDDVYVDTTLISDGSSTEPFMTINEVLGIGNEYTVQLIGERNRKGVAQYEVKTILSGGYMSDWETIRDMFDQYRQLVLLVTYDAPQGVTGYAGYTFEIDNRGGKHLK